MTKKYQRISPVERRENEEAIIWLNKKGVNYRSIRFFKWRYFDYDKKIVRVSEITKRGREKIKKIRYKGSPLEKIAARNEYGQKGKHIFVFYTTIVSQYSLGFPCGHLYDETDVKHICMEAKAEKYLQNNNAKLLTFKPKRLIIEVSR